MWTDGVVRDPPSLADAASFAKPAEKMLVEALLGRSIHWIDSSPRRSRSRPLNASTNAFSVGFQGTKECHSISVSFCHFDIERPVSHVPSSKSINSEQPRWSIIRYSSSSTRMPDGLEIVAKTFLPKHGFPSSELGRNVSGNRRAAQDGRSSSPIAARSFMQFIIQQIVDSVAFFFRDCAVQASKDDPEKEVSVLRLHPKPFNGLQRHIAVGCA
jgi:hypothetical protein